MPTTFAQDANRYVITQSSRGFRVGFGIFVAFAFMGVGIAALATRIDEPETLSCDHLREACTLDRVGGKVEMPLATISDTHYDDDMPPGSRQVLVIKRNQFPNYLELCASSSEPARAAATKANAAELARFLADPNHAPFTIACHARDPGMGNPFVFGILVLGGILVARFIFRRFSTEVRACFDRAAGTVEVSGRQWMARRWSVKRPLSELARLETGTAFGPYGSRYFAIVARFSDGTDVTVYAPGAAAAADVERRHRELTAFLSDVTGKEQA